MTENRNFPRSKFQGDLKLGGIYWKDAVHVRQSEGLNQWQKNHFRLMKMVEYQESVVQGALERLLTRIGIEYSRKEYVPTNDEILDKLMSIDPEVQKLVLLNGKAAAMEMFVKQNYDLQGRYRNIFQGGRVPRNMTLKVINDYLDEVQAPSMEPSALEAYTSQMRTGLAEVTQRHIAKSVAQMTAWNWSRGRGIEELTRRFQEEQKKEQIDMSKVLPNAETVVRTESMKILNAEAWRSATEVGSYADGLLWGFSYHAVGDSRTRQTHLAQHGVCAPVDDPFWNEWTPPNGYNCRCWLISEWEEPSSYKQPRRDLHPDPGFAFNPANNISGRVPQPKKAEPKKPEVNTQSQEPVVKPEELVQNQEISPKYEKNIQKPVTTPKKKRYNNMGVSKSTVKPNAPRSPEPLIPEVQNGTIIPTPDGKFLAIHGPMVKTTRTKEDAAKAIRDSGGTVPEKVVKEHKSSKNGFGYYDSSLKKKKILPSSSWVDSEEDIKRKRELQNQTFEKHKVKVDYTGFDTKVAETFNKSLDDFIENVGMPKLTNGIQIATDSELEEIINYRYWAMYKNGGVYIHPKIAENFNKLSDILKHNYEIDNILPGNLLLHELGHAFADLIEGDLRYEWKAEMEMIFYRDDFSEIIESLISVVACRETNEMVAEAFAEYAKGNKNDLTEEIVHKTLKFIKK